MRTILLHYHLFKNAGTSLDHLLQENFADQWVTREFAGQNNTAQVRKWIEDTPDAVAFSSHTMMGPLPQVPGVQIISMMLLRDPISRIRSAYRFEHKQVSDGFGAVLARHTSYDGYVRVRLAMPWDRQCRSFQTWRLASLVPGEGSELERAKEAVDRLSLVGRVEAFDDFLEQLQALVEPVYPDFKLAAVHSNRSDALKSKTAKTDPDLQSLLQEANADDLTLLDLMTNPDPHSKSDMAQSDMAEPDEPQ
mgnify:CR=1 FL=1